MKIFLFVFSLVQLVFPQFERGGEIFSQTSIKTIAENTEFKIQDTPPEEILLQISSRETGAIDLIAYISDTTVYIPFGSLFDFLNIKYDFNDNLTSVSGFFIESRFNYNIDINAGVALMSDSIYKIVRKDFIISEYEIYMKSSLFGKIFGLELVPDLKHLSVALFSEKKLPAVIELERERARNSISRLTGQFSAEKNFSLNKHFLSGFFMDWSLNYSQTPQRNFYYYTTGLGGEVAGGDLAATFRGDKNHFLLGGNNINWRWRYVHRESPFFRQGLLGDVFSKSGQAASIQGIEVTNSPEYSRKLMGDYKISDYTAPGWKVELYLNNILVNYTIADSSGFYNFNIPITYGMNFLSLKFYGHKGEFETKDRVIQAPFQLLPENEFEYSFIAGKLKYFQDQGISELNFKWGAAPFFTVGAGIQYLNSDISRYTPGASLLFSLNNNMLFSLNYLHNNKTSGSFNIILPSLVTSEISVSKYAQKSFFSLKGLKEERRLSVFYPFRFAPVSSSLRFNLRNTISDFNNIISGNMGINISYSGFNFEAASTLGWYKESGKYRQSYLVSYLSAGSRIFLNFLLRQRIDIDHLSGKITRLGFYFDGRLFNRGWLSVNLYKNFFDNSFGVQTGFTFELPFSRSVTNYSSGNTWALQQDLSGSISYDRRTGDFIFDNQSWSGSGAVTLLPFIDKNNNDIVDGDEQILNTELKPNLDTGRLIKDSEKNIYRYIQLESYNSYLLKIDPYSFSDPLYRPKYKTFAVTIDPNQFKAVAIPLYASCEISGRVILKSGSIQTGLNSVTVNLESPDGKYKKQTTTFSNGEYLFEGLMPGDYIVYIKIYNRENISDIFPGDSIKVSLHPSEDGSFADGINFILTQKDSSVK